MYRSDDRTPPQAETGFEEVGRISTEVGIAGVSNRHFLMAEGSGIRASRDAMFRIGGERAGREPQPPKLTKNDFPLLPQAALS